MNLRNVFLKLVMGALLGTVALEFSNIENTAYAADFNVCKASINEASAKECEHVWDDFEITPATVKSDGVKQTKCANNCSATQSTTIKRIRSVKLSGKTFTYTGKAIKPSVTVKDSAGNTISKRYYTVSFSNNKKVGKATVKIEFKGNYSGTVSRTFKIKPSVTKIKKISAVANGISISWTKTKCGDGYEIFRSCNDEPYRKIAIVKTPNITKYTDKRAAVNGNKYKYRVVVTADIGDTLYKSSYSKTKGTYYVSKVYVNLENASNGIRVSWSANDKADGYYVYRRSSGKKYTKIRSIRGNATTSFIDKNADVNGKYYKYKVVAFKTAGGKKYRGIESSERVNYFIESPQITTLNNVLGMKMVIRWSELAKINGYRVEYSTDSTFNNSVSLNINDRTNTTRMITNLVKDKKYYVRVRAYKTVNSIMYFSAWSDVKSVYIKSKNTIGSNIQIGDSYLEIDLGNQHVYYLKKGKLVYDTECVSGCKAWGMSTPAGVYTIGNLERNATLVGDDYKTIVEYWIPFIGNEIGLHDAPWKTEFGGDIWKTDGSHGCINLSSKAAKDLYGMVYKGLPVIVYY